LEKERKSKLINISLWALLAVLILFVIVTSCMIKSKQDRIHDLSQKNEQIEDILDENSGSEENV